MAAAQDDAADVRNEAQEAASRASARVKAEADRLADDVRDSARGILDQQQRSAADYLNDLSDAFGEAKRSLEDRGHGHTAQVLASAAEEFGHLSAEVGQRDPASWFRGLEDFAHRRPGLFFAGALVAGFGAVRFLESSRSRDVEDPAPQRPGPGPGAEPEWP